MAVIMTIHISKHKCDCKRENTSPLQKYTCFSFNPYPAKTPKDSRPNIKILNLFSRDVDPTAYKVETQETVVNDFISK